MNAHKLSAMLVAAGMVGFATPAAAAPLFTANLAERDSLVVPRDHEIRQLRPITARRMFDNDFGNATGEADLDLDQSGTRVDAAIDSSLSRFTAGPGNDVQRARIDTTVEDQFSFDNTVPVNVTFELDIDSSASASGNPTLSFADSSFRVLFDNPGTSGFDGEFHYDVHSDLGVREDMRGDVVIPVAPGETIELDLDASLRARPFLADTEGVGSRDATAEMNARTFIREITDAATGEVLSDIGVTTASGVVYDPPAPTRPDQILALDFENPISKEFVVKKNLFTGNENVVEKNGTDPLHQLTSSEQQDVVDAVRDIFSDSGLGLPIVVGDHPDALVARFGDLAPRYDDDGDSTTNDRELNGRAFDITNFSRLGAIDRFNKRLDGEVAVFTRGAGGTDSAGEIAEVVAHEFGHGLGLRHINPFDDSATEVMDYQSSATERFTNTVAFVREPPENDNTDRTLGCPATTACTQNSQYHLRRYSVGQTHGELVSLGANPGNWDTGSFDLLRLAFDDASFSGSLHEVAVQTGSISGLTDVGREFETIAFFDTLDAPGLAALDLLAVRGSRLRVLGSSTPGGDWDTFLGFGDAADPLLEIAGIQPGALSGSLFRFAPGNGTFSRIGTFAGQLELARTVSASVPAPAPAGLAALGLSLLVLRVRWTGEPRRAS